MNRAPAVVRWSGDTPSHPLAPATLKQLGKDEEFLESVLAEHPELLGIQNRRTGIYGPFGIFRQVSLPTPAGREIYPDIVMLAASGHFIVVEVKLGHNQELKDRRVIAQIIDYASSFAALDEQQLIQVFDKTLEKPESWIELVTKLFPNQDNSEELADLLLERASTGALNLVIACDRVPPGVPELVSGIASQQTTAFDLDLVEVQPFADVAAAEGSEILFVPTVRLSTEIVARTVVTINDERDAAKASVSVLTTSLEEIERKSEEARTDRRRWSQEEVEQLVRDDGDPVEIELLDFAKQHSYGQQIVDPQPKIMPTFGFYVAGRRLDGKQTKYMFFGVTHSHGTFWLAMGMIRQLVNDETMEDLDRRLRDCFKGQLDASASSPGGACSLLANKLDEFKEIVLWFQKQAASRLSEGP